MLKRINVVFVLMLVCLSVLSAASWTPSKEVTMIVPYDAGGGSDMMARIWTAPGAKYFKTAFAVENIPGGSQAIG